MKIEGFEPYSFIIGTQHSRSFTFDDVGGVIADYILGECGATKSPVSKKHFDTVYRSNGSIDVAGNSNCSRIKITRDKVIYSERTSEHKSTLPNISSIVKNGTHLLPEIYSLLHNPPLFYTGMVWEYVHIPEPETQRFQHPAAKLIYNKLIDTKLGMNEYPSHAEIRFNYRKKLSSAVTSKRINDFLNISVFTRTLPISELWPPLEPIPEGVEIEPPKAIALSIDIQRIHDPRKPIEYNGLSNHYKDCKSQIEASISKIIPESYLGFPQK